LVRHTLLALPGASILLILWWLLKSALSISDRYLPSPSAVIDAAFSLEPNILIHTGHTCLRLVLGFATGATGGIFLGIALYQSTRLRAWAMPSIQSLRAIPATATVPFFLLWFGFAETGRYLLVFVGTVLNLAIASYQILKRIPDKYIIMFRSMNRRPESLTLKFLLPSVLERILPTLRFALATALGLVVVSELLGSQVGLGYLIQTARSTFSLQLIFLAAILLGVMNFCLDFLLRWCWGLIVFWR
jgi:ABC-type nitrate/sulfonate/bicarbonate transport system permease component